MEDRGQIICFSHAARTSRTTERSACVVTQDSVMLGVILNKLVTQAEQILEEEHAGFRLRRSSTEQIFTLRVLVEK